ncbi:MAG: potassium channel protein [Acidobacteria bacterium]|nr:potassium channel protein [Acidobacteriota bacterium]
MHPFRRLLPAALLLSVIVAIGIAGYVTIEHWSILEAAYMVVIALFTVGFEEVHPLSRPGMIFTMLLVILGVGTAVYIAGQAVEIIVEGEIFGYQRKKRMAKQISAMKDHYIICGFGRVGHRVAEAFDSSGITYVVIDAKPETERELEAREIPAIIGDATSDEILKRAGIERARCLVACSDSDVANVYVTLSARALNPNLYIVARAGLHDIENKLIMAGANRVLSPYFIAGRRMAAMATRPVTCDFLDLVTHGGQVEFSIYEIAVPSQSQITSRTLGEADIRGLTGAVVLAIRRADGSFDLQPNSSSRIESGDILVILAAPDQIEKLEQMIE